MAEEQPKKTLTDRLKNGARIGKKAIVATRIALATAIGGAAVGGGVYVYKQFHKTPEKIQQETAENKEKAREAVEEIVRNTTKTVAGEGPVAEKVGEAAAEAAGKIARKGTEHGGAVREWLTKKLDERKKVK